MIAARQIIKSSLGKLGVIDPDESLNPSDAQNGLFALNLLLDDWSNSKLTVFGVEIEEFTLIGGQNTYTMGEGGNFDTTVPIKTLNAFLRYDDSSEIPIKIISREYWGGLQSKNSTSTIPSHIYIDSNHPLAKVYLYPTPSEANTLILHNQRQFSQFETISTELDLPKGYARALIYNLCLDLAPEYGKSPSAEIYKNANQSLSSIKRSNIEPTTARVDGALLNNGGFNWRSGE